MKALQKQVSILGERSISKMNELISEVGDLASVIQWGFEEIGWRLEQTNMLLQGIDETLKTPTATQANEWRQIAEKLRI
jgi:hypothetical protein